MTLLLAEVDPVEATGDPGAMEVTGVEHDSRRVVPGNLFVCLAGATTDGHDHVPEAVERGAVGVVSERPSQGAGAIVYVQVAPGAARPALARLAAAFQGHPARELTTIGVTGTNGKTTVVHLLGAVLDRAGLPTTVLGTLSGERTTPEATELQSLLAGVHDATRAEGCVEPWQWRSRLMRWCSRESTRCASTWRSSPISVTITWTSTAPWTPTGRQRPPCSHPDALRAAS